MTACRSALLVLKSRETIFSMSAGLGRVGRSPKSKTITGTVCLFGSALVLMLNRYDGEKQLKFTTFFNVRVEKYVEKHYTNILDKKN